MSIKRNKSVLLVDHEILEHLAWIVPLLTFLALLTEAILSKFKIFQTLESIIFLVLLYFLRRTRSVLNYSYWTFALVFIFFIASHLGLVLSYDIYMAAVLWTAVIGFLTVEFYILSSPLYYPILKWWEYDFRFRHDVEVNVCLDNNCFNGRIGDLRRRSCCVLLFENLNLDQAIRLEIFNEKLQMIQHLSGKVATRRSYSIGRPGIYGVKLVLKEKDSKQNYNQLVKYWKHNIKLKKENKYRGVAKNGN